MSEPARPQLDVDGAGAPPRRNGELVFQEPWEGRAFGLAVALGEKGFYSWEAFRSRLIAAIAEADCRPQERGTLAEPMKSEYYDHWLTALRRLLVDSGVLTPGEVENRMREFATGQRDIVTLGGP